MGKVIIGTREKEYKQVIDTMLYTQQKVDSVRPEFEAQNIPFNLANIRDLLSGAYKIEKFLYERLESDLERINTPELRKQQKKLVEENFWHFLNNIRKAVEPKHAVSVFSDYLEPAEAKKYFHHFTIDKDGSLKLLKGWKERVKEKFIIYADERQLKMIELGEKACELLNEVKNHSTLGDKMPLKALIKEEAGRFVFNRDCERSVIGVLLTERSQAGRI